MELSFSKYQGAGNDFVLIDNLSGGWDSLSLDQIRFICNRKFGVGADGLIKINKSDSAEFEVDYYNSDGSKSFCGNGARCAVRFTSDLGISQEHVVFDAIDGKHGAFVRIDNVDLEMNDVSSIEELNADFVLHTGSPHYIRFVHNLSEMNVVEEGRFIRYNQRFKAEGINVNFVEILDENHLAIRTYERGVEDETLACGTGITAAALAFAYQHKWSGSNTIYVKAQGGDLTVRFEVMNDSFSKVILSGPAVHVFDGKIGV